MHMMICNWKMELPAAQALAWLKEYTQELNALTQQSTIVICPDFCTLWPARPLIHKTALKLGAQDCSAHAIGPYTGQVSAQSLSDAGCSYCIIGHSELRARGQTDQEIAQKARRLQEIQITPIICVGETEEQHNAHNTLRVISEQLGTALEQVTQETSLVIAYEPVWAVGSDRTPTAQELAPIVKYIREMCAQYPVKNYKIVYGGSVNGAIAAAFKPLGLDGYLVGRASLDFQKLKNIVLSAV